MSTRRDFITALGGLTASALALGRVQPLSAMGLRAGALDAIGLQLYTVRALMGRDPEATIARVAEIGYREVEFAGYFGRTPAQVRAVLAANHLTSPSTHIGYPATGDAWSRTLDQAAEMGHQWVVIASFDAALRKTADDWHRVADRFNEFGRKSRERNLRFGYHNHDFEFTRVGDQTGLDVLISRTDPAFVDFEMDIYWVVKGGADPMDLIRRYPHRFALMHAKDATAAPERTMTEVGSGTIDFRTIFANANLSGMQHVFVEHDQPADALESARVSYRYLAALKYT